MARSRHDLSALRELDDYVSDPWRFIPDLVVVDLYGKKHRLGDAWESRPEQKEILGLLLEHQNTLILKPRQVGCTTVITGFLAWVALNSVDSYSVACVTHEDIASVRVNTMVTTYFENLPKELRPDIGIHNTHEVELKSNGSMFRQMVAGGRGQGRSATYQAVHATEMGFWPRGSSATSTSSQSGDVEGADDTAWASVQSTLHMEGNPKARKIVESTANGPTGLFHKATSLARSSPEWAFLFLAWYQFAAYERQPRPGWERTDEEDKIAATQLLPWLEGKVRDEDLAATIDRKLAWRRNKIVDEMYGLDRFRREYPGTWEEPFLLGGGMWFDSELLNELTASIDRKWLSWKSPELVFEEPRPGVRYFIGVDTAGGVGKDACSVQVIRSDLAQVAVWRSRLDGPNRAAERAAELSLRYNRAPVLCEKNRHGATCIDRMRKLGVKLWTDDKGKDFWTDPVTKLKLMNTARDFVNGRYCTLRDPETVGEMLRVREQKDGNIGADAGFHDDNSFAFVLALWNARRQNDATRKETPAYKVRAAKQRALQGGKERRR